MVDALQDEAIGIHDADPLLAHRCAQSGGEDQCIFQTGRLILGDPNAGFTNLNGPDEGCSRENHSHGPGSEMEQLEVCLQKVGTGFAEGIPAGGGLVTARDAGAAVVDEGGLAAAPCPDDRKCAVEAGGVDLFVTEKEAQEAVRVVLVERRGGGVGEPAAFVRRMRDEMRRRKSFAFGSTPVHVEDCQGIRPDVGDVAGDDGEAAVGRWEIGTEGEACQAGGARQEVVRDLQAA